MAIDPKKQFDEAKELSKILKENDSLQKQIDNAARRREIEIINFNEKKLKQSKKLLDLQNKLNNKTEELAKAEEEFNIASEDGTKTIEEKLELAKKINVLKYQELKLQKEEEKELNKITESYEKQKQYIKDSVKSLFDVSKLTGGIKNIAKDTVKSFFEQDQLLRDSAKSIGLGSSQYQTFAKTAFVASQNVAMIGLKASDLTKLQASYNASIGKSVMLTAEQQVKMGELAVGTTMGVDGSAELAGNMELLGVNTDGTVKLVNSMFNKSQKMGVSAEASTKKLLENVKLAQSYNFSTGIKGLQEMAVYSAKIGLSMETIGNVSQKAFNVEGAVEMAAKLQVLGGEFAKIGDWSQLLYKSREDMEGLMKDVASTVANLAEFDPSKGIYTITAVKRQQLKEAADAMGVDFKELETAGIKQAQFRDIKAQMSISIPEDMKDLVTGLAQNKNGVWMVKVGETGELKKVSDLNAQSLEALKVADQTMRERAEQATGFDTMWKGLIEEFKSTLYPAIQETMPALRDGIKGLVPIVKSIGSFISSFGAGGLVAGYLAVAAIDWGLKGGLFGNIAGTIIAQKVAMAVSGKPMDGGMDGGMYGKGNYGSGMRGRAMSGLKGGAAMGVIGAGMNLASGGGVGESVGMGLGSIAGGMIGQALIPIPGVGFMIGSALGAWGGSALGSSFDSVNDGIIRSDGSITKINKADDLVAMKPNGVIDNIFSGGGNTAINGNIALSPLQITGEINLKYNGENVKGIKSDILNDSHFIDELMMKIQKSSRSNMNGGILQPAPLR